jgi:hypothetical protein
MMTRSDKSIGGSFHRVASHNIEIHTSTGDFPIIKLIHEYGDLSKRGFAKANKEPRYKVQEVCDNLVRIMNIYNESHNLTEAVFNQLIEAYRPFLESYMTYKTMKKRVEESKNMEGWLDA